MKKNLNILKCFMLIILSAFLFTGCSLMDFLFPPEKVETYQFSGYVFADDMPLPDATVSCGLSEITTDERGYYSFSNLTKVVQVTVKKEGYYFDDTLVYIKSNRNDVNFEGNKYYNISGSVKDGLENVANANVKVTSKSGTYVTSTNSYGDFYLSKLAGIASISANYEDIEFFSQEVNKETEFVTINSAIEVKGSISCDSSYSNNDFILKCNDEIIEDCLISKDENSLIFNIKNVKPNTKIKLESSSFFIDNNEFTVTNENRQVSFNCEKFYSANIKVVSGQTILQDAELLVNGNIYLTQNNNGLVLLENLHGESIITARLNDFNFDTKTINYNTNNDVTITGTFDLNLDITTDDNLYDDIKVIINGKEISVLNNKLNLLDVQLGDNILIDSDNYYIENQEFEILSTNNLVLNLFRYFTLNLSVTYKNNPLSNVNVIIGDDSYNLNTNGLLIVDNLYGNRDVEINLNGYKFDKYITNINNCNIEAVAKKIFNLTGKVVSGDIILENAIVRTNNQEILTDNNGEFVVEGLYEGGTIVASLNNYNEAQIEYEIENEYLIINLTYNIAGEIVCGDNKLNDVIVKVGEQTTTTNLDGKFVLSNLQGNSKIEFEKAYYNFSSVNVNKENKNILVTSTYYIEGNVTDSTNNAITDFNIILIDVNSDEQILTTTNNEGYFIFNNLLGEYVLLYDTNVDFTLKPSYHDVTSGGRYNFSNNGYGFSGRVMCGEIPVANVQITAGEQTTTTNEQGYYTFALITKPTTLSLYKNGYTFENNNFAINEELDERIDINFNCTYSISGNVLSGKLPLENALVEIQNKVCQTDESGYYVINGIEGHASITITKQGYTFEGKTEISEAETLSFNAYYTAKYKIVTGEINVSGVTLVTNNGSFISDSSGLIIVENVEIGESFTLSKEGYNFSDYTFNGFSSSEIIINCSYNIVGTVFNGEATISNVSVLLNNNIITTSDSNGCFVLNNLEGKNYLSFSMENYQFDNIEISSPINLEVYAKYSVSGYVKVGSSALSNVKVIAGKFETTTNGAGYFEINGLTTKVNLILEKEGYEFEGQFEVNGFSELEFKATYMVCGYVRSGSDGVSGVLVTSSIGGNGIETDLNGYYEIRGQEGIITLTFEKDGYETVVSQSINAFTNNLNVNLTYSVVINFSGTDDYSGIFVSVNGSRKEYSDSTITLSGLEGFNKITFSKTGYSFNPNEYGVEGYVIIEVELIRYYSANFRVVTDSGLFVSDAQVYAGTKLANFGQDGKYYVDELSNKVNVYAYFSVKNSEGKELFSYTKNYGIIEDSGTYTITISNDEYAYFMFVRAYQRLRDIYAYRITVNGVVTPRKFAGPQSVSMIYKKVGDFRIYENLNYGDKVDILGLGVDPRVSMLTVSDLKNKTAKYQLVRSEALNKDLTANYSTTWQAENVSFASYQSTFGASADGFYPYNITKETIKTLSTLKVIEGSNDIQLSISLNTGDVATANYKTLMNKLVPEQTIGNFGNISLTFTFDSNGNIKTLQTSEWYEVKSFGQTVVTDGAMTYNYSTSEYNENISQIDASSNEAIRRTLNETLPQDVKTAISKINKYILNKRKEEV